MLVSHSDEISFYTIKDQMKQEAGIPILFQILLTRAEKT